MVALGDTSTDDTVDLRVTIDKTELDGETAASLLDVSVTKTIGAAAQLTLRVPAWDSDAEELRWVDDGVFAPGAEIEVEMGYLDRLVSVFHGDIVNLALEVSNTSRAVLTLTAYDVLHRLGRGQRRDVYKELTSAGIVRDVARRIYQLDVEAPDDPEVDQEYVCLNQTDQSDLQFILALANKIDYELFAEGPKLVFRRSRRAGAPELTLDAGRDLIQFSGRIDARSQLGGVDLRALDSATGQEITVTEDNASTTDGRYRTPATRSVLLPPPVDTHDQAEAIAKAELERIHRKYLEASGTALGRPDLEPGTVIQLDNLGKRFSGAYYVTSVTHSLSESGGLRTSFTLEGRPR